MMKMNFGIKGILMRINDILTELKKPKDIDKFRKFYQELEQGTANSSWRYYVNKVLAEYGFKQIGKGSFASVYSNPKYPYVLKVFRKDDGYVKWFNFCRQHQGNPLIPIIRGKVVKITEMFFAVRLEKLRSYNGFSMREPHNKLNKLFADKIDNKQQDDLELTGNKYIDPIIKVFLEHEGYIDLHAANLMKRQDGQIVIIDPFFEKEEHRNHKYSRSGFNESVNDMSDKSAFYSQANAFGGILTNNSGKILLRKPANHYGGYVWTFAKGRQDHDETPQETALREVYEETGYRAKITGVIPKVFAGETSSTIFFMMKPISQQESYDWETSETVWVNLDEAMELVSQNETSIGRKRDMSIISILKGTL